jgi:16S rRNA (cytosine1402-N4)-methyltransferase
MTDPLPKKPRRRPRYAGKNPQNFREKYKEHQPDRYAADVEKVLASGKTPAGMHRPIMVREIMEILAPQPGEIAVDVTLGYGGHARHFLEAIAPCGRLIGLDVDPLELPKTEARLHALGFGPDVLTTHRMNYAGLVALLAREAPGGVDIILADLGLSSMQIDNPARGFTFKAQGPLDLRMNPERGQPASALLASIDVTKLEQLLMENADEPNAARLAHAIVDHQTRVPITTTTALASIVRQAIASQPRSEPNDTIRRVFQALRIAVNDEFSALETFLRHLPQCLRSGGHVAILTFHSGEDRRVKHAFKAGLQEGLYSEIARDVLRPSAEELRANPRSASAKLRYARRADSVLKT